MTNKSTSLLCAYLFSENHSTKIPFNIEDDLPSVAADERLWVHLNYDKPETEAWIEKNVSSLAATVLCESRPRSFTHHNGMFLTLRGINLNEGSDPEDMVSVRIWASENLIVTTQRRKLKSIEQLMQDLDDGAGPDCTNDFLITLAQNLLDQTNLVLDAFDDKVEAIEDETEAHPCLALRADILNLRRQVIQIRRFMAPQRDAIGRMTADKLTWMHSDHLLDFREISDRAMKLVEDLDEIKDRLVIIQESLVTLSQEQLNKRMYVLSMVAAIFLPLGFITGLLGVNVGGIPGATAPYGFDVLLGMLGVILIGMLFYFKKSKWF